MGVGAAILGQTHPTGKFNRAAAIGVQGEAHLIALITPPDQRAVLNQKLPGGASGPVIDRHHVGIATPDRDLDLAQIVRVNHTGIILPCANN